MTTISLFQNDDSDAVIWDEMGADANKSAGLSDQCCIDGSAQSVPLMNCTCSVPCCSPTCSCF